MGAKKQERERKPVPLLLLLTAMHRMNPPVAAGSEKLGTIVTVVSSAMKAICCCWRAGKDRGKRKGGGRGCEKETKKEKNCAHLSLCLSLSSILNECESLSFRLLFSSEPPELNWLQQGAHS